MQCRKPSLLWRVVALVLSPFVALLAICFAFAAVLGVGILCCIGEHYSQHNAGHFPH